MEVIADADEHGDAGPESSMAYLIELVLEVAGPVIAAEPLLRDFRSRLTALNNRLPADGQLGALVSQEFGSLTCTVRAVVEAIDVVSAINVAAQLLRPSIGAALVGQSAVRFRECAVHARAL